VAELIALGKVITVGMIKSEIGYRPANPWIIHWPLFEKVEDNLLSSLDVLEPRIPAYLDHKNWVVEYRVKREAQKDTCRLIVVNQL
jgi:hypothetical protein